MVQGRIQDFVRGGAKPSDVRKTVAISANIINSKAFVHHLFLFGQSSHA